MITSHQFKISFLLLLLTLSPTLHATPPTPPTSPNIVILIADDLGFGDITAYNPQSKIPTPNIDALAKQGARFTDAHAAASVCTPSRYALLTGRYCWRSRLKRVVLFNYEPPLIETSRLTLASLLQSRGYATAMFGKWHLGLGFTAKQGQSVDFNAPLPWYPGSDPDPNVSRAIDFTAPIFGGPTDLGFDHAFYSAGCATDQEPYCFIENKRALDMVAPTYRRPDGSNRFGMTAPFWVNETVDITYAQKATEYIRSHTASKPDQPFFVYLPLSSPHSPHLPPWLALDKSDAGPRGDLVWLVDWVAGRIAQTLDDLNIADNTLFIVTSDNGPLKGSLLPASKEGTATITNNHMAAGDWSGYKGTTLEGGHRVPLVIRWPGHVPANTTHDALVGLNDLFATFAELTSSKPLPQNVAEDSISFLPQLLGQPNPNARQSQIHHSGAGSFAIRSGPWKLIVNNPNQKSGKNNLPNALYNLEVDPQEQSNLFEHEPQIVARLAAQLEEHQASGRSRE